ncbi:MAG: BBP7 family outer membrane beta-barrel protein [Gemmataceae bacterium]
MTYRWIVALVAASALVGAGLAGEPALPAAVMERPLVPTSPCCPAPAEAPDCGATWFAADYLLSYVYGSRLPVLVTTNPADTPRGIAGILGNPTTVPLFFGRVNADERSGLRVQGGYWFDEGHRCGLEAGGSVIESQSTLFSGFNRGDAILARPYVNVLNQETNARIIEANRQNPPPAGNPPPALLPIHEAVLVTFPNASSGGITARVTSGNFYEAHIDVSDNFWDEGWLRIDGLLGYRMYRYDEGLRFRQVSTVTNDPNLPAGTTVFAGDDFSTQNEFHGVDLGIRGTFRRDNLTVEVLAKVAGGNLRRRVDISGGQQVTVPGAAPELRVGGVFALASNIGRYEFNDLAALPELGFTVRYQVTDYLRLRAGYNILFLENVSRAAQQIDSTLNPNLFPGSGVPAAGQTQRPAPTNEKDNVWIMNVGLGLEVMF